MLGVVWIYTTAEMVWPEEEEVVAALRFLLPL